MRHIALAPRGWFRASIEWQRAQRRRASWTTPRRVVAKVEWHPGELFPRVGFIVTNLRSKSKNVVGFYNKCGTCEQSIKEGKGAIKWTRLSCRSFTANAVRLQLHALAYNLGNFLRTLAIPEPIAELRWSTESLPCDHRPRRRQHERPANAGPGKTTGDLSPFDRASGFQRARPADAGAIRDERTTWLAQRPERQPESSGVGSKTMGICGIPVYPTAPALRCFPQRKRNRHACRLARTLLRSPNDE